MIITITLISLKNSMQNYKECTKNTKHKKDNKMKEKIQIGDKVDVYWENISSEFNMRVLYVPCATGDSWRLRRLDGTVIYVNSFGKMVRKIGE